MASSPFSWGLTFQRTNQTPVAGPQTLGLPAWAPVCSGAAGSSGLSNPWKAVERIREMMTFGPFPLGVVLLPGPLQQRDEGPGKALCQSL